MNEGKSNFIQESSFLTISLPYEIKTLIIMEEI